MHLGDQELAKDIEDMKRRTERKKKPQRVPSTDHVRSTNSSNIFEQIENGSSEDHQINNKALVEAQKTLSGYQNLAKNLEHLKILSERIERDILAEAHIRTLYGHQKLAEDFESKKRRLKRKERALLRTDVQSYFEPFENGFHGADSSHRRIPEPSTPDDVRGRSPIDGETSYFSSNKNGYPRNEISQRKCSNNENPTIAGANISDVLNNEVGTGVVISKECIYDLDNANDAMNGEACIVEYIENEVGMELDNERDIFDIYDSVWR